MNLLDEGRGTRRHRKEEVAQGRQRAAPFAGERDGVHPHGASLLECGDDVLRGAGRADAEQHAPWLSVGLGLPREDRIVRVIVGPRRSRFLRVFLRSPRLRHSLGFPIAIHHGPL
jgi:hypothetical protein